METFVEKQILIVDDLPSLRHQMRNLVGKLGITRILEAGNGQEAWELLQAHPVHCVLLDWEMPVMNGLQLLERLKADTALAGVPVLMITAKGDELLKAVKLGVNGFLIKPVNEAICLSKLTEILSK